MSGQATIITYSVVHVAASDFAAKAPYLVALLEKDGRRFVAMVEGKAPDLPSLIGVKVVLRPDDGHGPKADFQA